jgi:sirohydrochlorin cobaltochelatase
MLVGHGTRDDLGTREFLKLGERLAETLSPIPVQSCLLEFQHPTIPEAWNSLVESGVKHVHVAPLLLFAAGHAKNDIPDLVKRCQTDSPEITFDQARPLSRHHSIIELVCQRIDETFRSMQSPRSLTALIMVGRGSHDPCAQADMRVLTEVVNRKLRFPDAYTSFYAMAEPRLPEVIDSVASSGNYNAIIVQPHLLFAGHLYQAIQMQVDEAARRHPGMSIGLSRYLGPDPLVAEAIASRVGAAKF